MHRIEQAFADLMAAARDAASKPPVSPARAREPLATYFADRAKVVAQRARQANGR